MQVFFIMPFSQSLPATNQNQDFSNVIRRRLPIKSKCGANLKFPPNSYNLNAKSIQIGMMTYDINRVILERVQKILFKRRENVNGTKKIY